MTRIAPLLIASLTLISACDSQSSTRQDTADDSVPITGSDLGGDTEAASADFYTPAVIADILKTTRAVTWTELSSPVANLTRFSIGAEGTSHLIAVSTTTTGVGEALVSEMDVTTSALEETDRLLRTIFKFVEVDAGFRIMSTKHPMYGLDARGSDLILSDIRSVSRPSEAGYVVFTVEGSGSARTLTASGRHVWSDGEGAFVSDSTWAPLGVGSASGGLVLTDTATPFTLYNPPIDLDLPSDLNPDGIGRVSNPEFLARDEGPNHLDTLTVSQDYAPQITARGPDQGTAAAAASMLDTIKADLAAEGASMRYPAEFYLTWREGMLSRTLVSAGTFDGSVGQKSVPLVYFTNEASADGTHHPFMVIATYGLPDSLSLFWDIPRPPGDGLGGGYDNEAVTRIVVSERHLIKIPLRDYGLVSSLTENTMVGSLAADEGVTQYDHHNYASVSATGVAIDGVVVYPSYNNRLQFAQAEAELSTHGMHAGRGLDAHYHSDAHSASGDGLNIYNASDYEGHTHPPVISMGFDGVAGYGIYKKGDTTSDGWDVSFDEFAGHSHGAYGYHYHSVSSTETSGSGVSYTTHMFPPRGAWAGKINDIPSFWDNNRPDYTNTGVNLWVGQL